LSQPSTVFIVWRSWSGRSAANLEDARAGSALQGTGDDLCIPRSREVGHELPGCDFFARGLGTHRGSRGHEQAATEQTAAILVE
jgi:hypothetical protein